MLPISPSLCGVLFSAVSRTARGEFDLSEEARESLDAARENVEEFSDLVGDFRLTEPGSWSRFFGRLMDYSFETQGRFRDAREAREALGFGSRVELPAFLVAHVRANAPTRCVYEDDESKLEAARLADDTILALEIPVADSHRSSVEAYRNAETTRRSAVIQSTATLFWRDQRAVMLDHHVDAPTASPLDLSEYEYYGERLNHIDQWREFREAGIRRNVLLQGPPGCGKSTLCCHAARELSARTVVLTPTCFTEFNLRSWLSMLEVLQPEMVILDDVDRIQQMSRYDLQEKLRFFEEGFCEVPFVLFTSNDCSRLPEAMRRPGRIDQIIRFDEPALEVQRTIVRELAEREGVDVPDAHLQRMVDLLDEYSAAHVVEALRRAKVIGWASLAGDDSTGAGDKTFLLHRDFDSKSDWLKAHGYHRLEIDVDFVTEALKSHADREVAYQDDHDKLYRLVLPNGAHICFDDDGANSFRGDQLFFRSALDGRDAALVGIGELFWHGRDAVLLDSVGDRTVSLTLPPAEQPYYGELLECIARWRRFREAGLRRNVLIQGPPGCGKSTFCRHAARELADRTLMMTPEFYESIRCAQWRQIGAVLQPEIVIIDDVDRVSSHSLESKLRLFEEDYCDIPFVLFTSNDHTKLPRPMRRP
ncbi:MAG: AAA family ATPase, partial [Myxococcota bacterium]